MGIKALVVDDNEINGMMMQNILENYRVQTRYAENGMTALRMAAADDYDIVFMDYIMPGMNGVETTHRMRGIIGCENIQVVALTADIYDELREEFKKSGVERILTKPIDPQKIGELLNELFGISKEDPSKQSASDAEQAELLESLKGINGLNFELGMHNSLDSEKNFHLVLKMAVKNITECEQNVNKFMHDAADAVAAKIALHSLKGIFINIGMEKLSREASMLESRLKDNTYDIKHDLEDFDKRLLQVLQEISQAVAAYDDMQRSIRDKYSKKAAEQIKESREELIANIMSALLSFDIDFLTENLEKLAALSEGDERKAFELALDAAAEFDYDYVSEVMRKLK